MSYDFSPTIDPADADGHPTLAGTPAAGRRFAAQVDDLLDAAADEHARLWAYYRNDVEQAPENAAHDAGRPYRQAQEHGLPPRITGRVAGDRPFDDRPAGISRKEISVENDIGWRVDAGVDFLFGRPLVLDSAAPDDGRAAEIGGLLRGVLAANGGLGFLQELALVAAVGGEAHVVVKLLDDADGAVACDTARLGGGDDEEDASPLARRIRLEIVEPGRAMPIFDPLDATRLLAFAQCRRVPTYDDKAATPAEPDWLRKLFGLPAGSDGRATVVELIGPRGWRIYRDARLAAHGPNPLGRLPVVCVRNAATPAGMRPMGEVGPLIPLQDELNTRLSDRAHRVALQSQRMYLGVGVDGFADQPVTPGRMWSSDNPDARVSEFGGDAQSPSEQAAITEVREAMDKLSGVSPVASGAIRGRVGNLTSAAALRLTFQSLLARTERKRVNFAAATAAICELSLAHLDAAGLFATTAAERRVKLTWPDPIPVDAADRLEQARLKQRLGIDPDVVRRELGY